MQLTNELLRICPKCKAKFEFADEAKKPCPRCGAIVWFYHYKPIPVPDPLPAPPRPMIWLHQLTKPLLGVMILLGIAAIFSVWSSASIAVVCTMTAIGFGVFTFLRHQDAVWAEQQLDQFNKVNEIARSLHERNADLVRRYLNLMATGDARIQHYYQEIFEAALRQKNEAREALVAAKAERQAVASVEERIDAMAERLVKDHLKWVSGKLRADPESYHRQKTTLTKTFDFVESVGYRLPGGLRKTALADLKAAYQEKVREQALKDEQRRIKQQVREEMRLQKEHEDAILEAETREAEIAARLDEALAAQAGVHSSEVEELQRMLAEAHAKSERAKSLAQLTKVGHVYILSNIGSFGEDVFKVGMTRREDPHCRVRELGDASVPFSFDVHAMISCQDAPALENALHRHLTRYRVNRVNLRKEYFRVELETILDAVEHHHGKVEYVADPVALEFRESQTISPEEVVERIEELAEMGVNLNEDDEFEPVPVE